MTEDTKPDDSYRAVIAVAAIVVVVAGLKAAASIVVPFLLAVFLAVLCGPPLAWLGRRGVPRGLAMLIVFALIATVGLGLATVIGGMVNRFANEWPTIYRPHALALTEQWNQQLQEVAADRPWLNRFRIEDATLLWSRWFDPESLLGHFTGAMRTLTGTLSTAFFILITTIFLLAEATLLPAKVRVISHHAEKDLASVERIATEINHYMGIKSWTSLLTGGVITVGLFLMGVNFALLWGLLAFLLNFVPNIGSILAAVPAVLWALIEQGFSVALFAAILYLFVNMLIGNVLEPRWMGRGLGLSTLFVFLSLVFWGWVLGPVGMVISVPLTMTIKIALESHDETRWMAVLMSGPPTENPRIEGKPL